MALRPDAATAQTLARWSERSAGKGFCREGGHVVFSDLLDVHVHFRVPGAEHKEDWRTGSAAAVAGGITGVLEMPNTNPPVTDQSVLDAKIAVAKKDSLCNYGFFAGASPLNLSQLGSMSPIRGIKLYVGSSTGTLLVDRASDIENVFRIAKKRNLVACVHAEEEALIRSNTVLAEKNGWNHVRFHSKIRSVQAEENAIAQCLELQQRIGNRLHVCHLTSAAGLELIREAKADGNASVSCEVTPNHLFLSEDDADRLGNFMKINPSIKSKSDQAALWKGIRDRVVDVVATDHAPHTVLEKRQEYAQAPSGIPGVQTMIPLLLWAVSREKLSLADIVRLCSKNPRHLFGLKEKQGCFSVVDRSESVEIKNESQFSKCGWSVFDGLKIHGTVQETYVNGYKVFDHTGVSEENRGIGVLL
ncbi:MAG: dihydroorotase [Candidatus Diapherotrites archaeon]|nr:dihydroorotase [Candidatus Diapherotrites archaeon]